MLNIQREFDRYVLLVPCLVPCSTCSCGATELQSFQGTASGVNASKLWVCGLCSYIFHIHSSIATTKSVQSIS